MSAPASPPEVLEWVTLARVAFSLLFVVALIYLVSALARKYGLDKRMAGVKGQQATLTLVETLYLDPRRRLVKVRSGEMVHTMLLGPNNDTLIASEKSEEKANEPA